MLRSTIVVPLPIDTVRSRRGPRVVILASAWRSCRNESIETASTCAYRATPRRDVHSTADLHDCSYEMTLHDRPNPAVADLDMAHVAVLPKRLTWIWRMSSPIGANAMKPGPRDETDFSRRPAATELRFARRLSLERSVTSLRS